MFGVMYVSIIGWNGVGHRSEVHLRGLFEMS